MKAIMCTFPIFVLILTLFLEANANAQIRSGLQEKREEILSDNYKVEWQANFTAETIEFAVTVKTSGYVGFGLSQSGQMTGADIVIGGVASTGTYFKDYHGTGNGPPVDDQEQSWFLLEGTENGGVTFLRFWRKLDTCDQNGEDIDITEGTIKIIWSYGETDNIGYHLSNRGALAVNMLDPPIPPVDLTEFGTTVFVKEVELTAGKDTIYWCTMFKRTADRESHIVAFEPKFDTPEALKHTHHFNMYTCQAPEGTDPVAIFDKFTGSHPGQDCFKDIPDGIPRQYCKNNLYAWSLGGRILVFPEDIGFPWGFQPNEYFLFEVHLDNPDKLGGVTFETGITIYDTDKLRPREAGMLAIGHSTGPSLMIPPRTRDWKIVGHCSSDCTAKHLDQEINLFNINLHAHISGQAIRVRHFRAGTELPWISNDMSYDADYQENRPLPEIVKVLPGDHVSIECTYDTNKKDGEASIGGFATSDEMCMLFAFYYPKSELENCFSGYSDDSLMLDLGIEQYDYKFEGSLDPTIILPQKWAGKTYSDILKNEIDWTSELKTSIQEKLHRGNQFDYCIAKDTKNPIFDIAKSVLKFKTRQQEFQNVTYPEVDKEYEQPSPCFEETTETPQNPATTDSSGGDDSTTESAGGDDSTTESAGGDDSTTERSGGDDSTTPNTGNCQQAGTIALSILSFAFIVL